MFKHMIWETKLLAALHQLVIFQEDKYAFMTLPDWQHTGWMFNFCHSETKMVGAKIQLQA